MTSRLVLRTLLVALAFIAATAIAWWGVAVAAAIFGAITHRDRGGAIVAGLGGVIAWGAILVYDGARGPIGTVATTLGGVLQVHPIAIYALTLAFAGVLALCSAVVARGLMRATSAR